MRTSFEGLEKILSNLLTDHINQPNIKIHMKDMKSANFKIYIERDGKITSYMTHHKVMWSTISMGSEFKRHFKDECYRREDAKIMTKIINYILENDKEE